MDELKNFLVSIIQNLDPFLVRKSVRMNLIVNYVQ